MLQTSPAVLPPAAQEAMAALMCSAAKSRTRGRVHSPNATARESIAFSSHFQSRGLGHQCIIRRCRNSGTLSSTRASYKTGKATPETRVFIDASMMPGSTLNLPPAEVAHLRARRIARGSRVTLFNSAGSVAVGLLQDAGEVLVLQMREDIKVAERRVSALMGLPKNPGRSDWAVEKLTELGVASIFFARTARAVAGGPGDKRFNRWERLAIAASKQSLRNEVPSVGYCNSFSEIMERVSRVDLALLLSANGDPLLSNTSVAAVKKATNIIILAGPEGGYTADEERMLSQAGARCINLGPSRLRVETAVVAAVAVLLQLELSEQFSQQ